MDDLPGIADGMAEASLLLMLRAGLVMPDQVVSLAAEYDLRADRESVEDEAERLRSVAHQLRLLSVDYGPPAAVDPAVEVEAAFRRRQIRQRTAWLARQSKPDA